MEQVKAVVRWHFVHAISNLCTSVSVQAATTLLIGLLAHCGAAALEGLNSGLMPFGNVIGSNLPKRPQCRSLVIIGILGVGVTFAEPAIGALQAFGSSVDVKRAPYLLRS